MRVGVRREGWGWGEGEPGVEADLLVELRGVSGEADADAVHQVLAQLGLLGVVRGDEQRPGGGGGRV